MVCVKKLILAGISFLSLMLFETQAKVTNSDSKVKLERAGKCKAMSYYQIALMN